MINYTYVTIIITDVPSGGSFQRNLHLPSSTTMCQSNVNVQSIGVYGQVAPKNRRVLTMMMIC